jgi:hypothetical protein
MQIQQKSYATFQLKYKNCDVTINPTASQKEGIVVYSLPGSPYLKHEVGEDALVINAAGEYESKDVFVTGRKVNGENGVVYTISAEEVTVGVVSFVTALSDIPVEIFESADVLIIGAGGGMNLSPKDAQDLLQKVTPKVCFIHGFEEQGTAEVKAALLPLEEIKKDVAGLVPSEKPYKTTKDELDRIDNTEVYITSNFKKYLSYGSTNETPV